jgi:hypothetical protein
MSHMNYVVDTVCFQGDYTGKAYGHLKDTPAFWRQWYIHVNSLDNVLF